MIDLLVSLAVISVLIAIMFPAIAMVRESARRVICGSNLRQIGMGVSMFADDNNHKLPDSVFLPPPRHNAQLAPAYDRMDAVRITREEFPASARHDYWDGLGRLFGENYIAASSLYYCPSHHGNFTFDQAASAWANLDDSHEIIVNYLFRGTGPNDSRQLYNIPASAALVTDTLRSYQDLNHEGGFNVLQAGLSVAWVEDVGDRIAHDILLRGDNGDSNASTVQNAWGRLDGGDGVGRDSISE